MQKKDFIWIAVLIAVAALYVHFFTHWFEKKELTVTPSLRPAMGGNAGVYTVVFNLNGQYKLKDVKALALENGKFNPKGHVVWEVSSDSNSPPTGMFAYGHRIKGMRDQTRPEPLQPEVSYRLVVSAGGLTGFTDFKTRAAN